MVRDEVPPQATRSMLSNRCCQEGRAAPTALLASRPSGNCQPELAPTFEEQVGGCMPITRHSPSRGKVRCHAQHRRCSCCGGRLIDRCRNQLGDFAGSAAILASASRRVAHLHPQQQGVMEPFEEAMINWIAPTYLGFASEIENVDLDLVADLWVSIEDAVG